MLIPAVSEDDEEGVNVTTKVVVPLFAATEDEGAVVTVKSEALVPVKLMAPIVNAAVPEFVIVYVSVTGTPSPVLPKSVLLVVAVVLAPFVIALPLPVIAILGSVNALQVPETAPAIQFAVLPVSCPE